MKDQLKNLIINLSPNKFKNAHLPVFLKHGVIEKPGPLFQKNYDNIEPETLHAQLEFLKEHFDIISLQEAINISKVGKSLQGKCSITFDDAYACLKTNAFPVLEHLNVPATVFVISNVINDKNLFWRDQIRQLSLLDLEEDFIKFVSEKSTDEIFSTPESLYKLSKSKKRGMSKIMQERLNDYFQEKELTLNCSDQTGCDRIFLTKHDIENAPNVVDFGNHTASHPNLCSLNYDEQLDEIRRCKKFLNGLKCNLAPILSLPFGAFNDQTVKAANMLGYDYIVYHSNKASNNNEEIEKGIIDRFTLPEREVDLGWLLLRH